MLLNDLLVPWLLVGLTLVPLLYLERWIQRHLFGLGWLITRDRQTATVLYYLILLPGVFLHEFSHWLVAGALNVRATRFMVWPEAQPDGTLRLGFVEMEDTTAARAALIGVAPFVVGVSVVFLISSSVLDLDGFVAALKTGDLEPIGLAGQALIHTPDFSLWLYLLFAVSNTMLPSASDRRGWPLVFAAFGICAAFLVLIGLQDVLIEALAGPIAAALNALAATLGIVFALDVGVVIGMGLLERLVGRLVGQEVDYSPNTQRLTARERPAKARRRPASIYDRSLPVPAVPKPSAGLTSSAGPTPTMPTLPSLSDTNARPAALPASQLMPPSRSLSGTPGSVTPSAEQPPSFPGGSLPDDTSGGPGFLDFEEEDRM